jgi:PAS domain S-box-containing protein
MTRDNNKKVETATKAILQALLADPNDADAVSQVIEIALHEAAREQEKKELQRVADLQASAHARLSRLLNASPAVIYSRHASGNYEPTFVSESITGLFGITPRQYFDNPDLWKERAHPDDVPRIAAWIETTFDNDDRSIEYRYRRSDGTYCWVNDRQHVIHDENGKPLEILGSWSDITALKEAEEARARAKAQLDHLLAAAPVVLYSFVASGDYEPTFVSPNIRNMLGYTPEEYMGHADFWRT